jgi:hypothetical protein
MGDGRHGGRLSPHVVPVVPNKPGRHGGRAGLFQKPTYDVNEARAREFCLTKSDEGMGHMWDSLGEFFKNSSSKPKQKKDD